jgi:3-phenylpropionate/trans-cinnamate dioxygenase ferredoxin reductase component
MTLAYAHRGPVVIVGAGHAGGTLAGQLRQVGYSGDIHLFGSEPFLPYHRPPLSKKFTGGGLEQWLKPEEFYAEQRITVHLGEAVASIDVQRKTIRTEKHTDFSYETLVLATGATPRRLQIPGADLDGIVTLRTLSDARQLRILADGGKRLVIIGAGFVGLEVAAALRTVGNQVVVLEKEERILNRVASREFSEYLAPLHVSRGTDIRTGVEVVEIEGTDDHRVRAVRLGDGTSLTCDAVLVGVGAIPNDELAKAAGIECRGGIVVDEQSRTSVQGVFAVGDVTQRPVPGIDGRMRLESIPSAVEQAAQVAAEVAGLASHEAEVPWFWSDQFDLKLKMAGILRPGMQPVVRGSSADDKFSIFHLENGVVKVIESINTPGDFMAAKRMIRESVLVDADALGDLQIPLRVPASLAPAMRG